MANSDSDASELTDESSTDSSAYHFANGSLPSALLDGFSDPVFVFTPEGALLHWNRRAREMIGYSEEELEVMNITEIMPEAMRPEGHDKLGEVAECGTAQLEAPLLTQGGETIPCVFECSRINYDDATLICGVVRDVTSQRRQEKEFRHLVEEVKEYAIFMLDTEGHVTTWNAGAERIKGYAEAEIIGRHFSTFYPEEEVQAGTPDEALTVAAREGQWTDEGWRVRKDGSRFWALVTVTAIHGEDGALRGFAKVTRDMSERRKREEALQKSEQRYRRLFEESRDAILLTTTDGAVVGANSAAEELFGYSRKELLNLEAGALYAQPKERKRRIIPALQEATSSRVLEARMRHKDGHTFLASASVTVHRNEEGDSELIQALVRDITEHRRLQQDVLRMQEAERRRIGRDLHDGVASQLTGITLSLSIAMQMLGEDHPAREHIRKAQGRIQESSQDVRRLSRGLSPMPLSDAGLAAALERLARNTDRCRLEEDEDLPALSGEEETHLYWIAQEAVTNARKYADANEIAIWLSCTGDELVLAVEDDGRGFDQSAGDDDGLGLRTMRYRAELLGGEFAIDSSPGEGARVECRLFLPGR